MGKIGYTGGAITIMVIFFFIAACLIAYSISNKKNDIIQMILICEKKFDDIVNITLLFKPDLFTYKVI